jgi:acetate kinase
VSRTASILVLNAGSSSLKFAAFVAGSDGALARSAEGEIEITAPGRDEPAEPPAAGTPAPERPARNHEEALERALARLDADAAEAPLAAVGHRVVHGGDRFAAPVRVDEDVLTALEALIPLAPLHQPHGVTAIRAVAAMRPELPQIACFDTAFHASLPRDARLFALPRELSDAGVRRYGFHGLSYEWAAERLAALDPAAARGRAVVAHLGNGASLCALRGGRSIATTMGMTALDGLVMGTRCGALDPGVVLHLVRRHDGDVDAVEDLLYRRSGLLGVSGVSSDMRTLLASDDPHAAEAVDLFVDRIARELGALAAALGGLDALVFTGGIGEHATAIRARVCRAAAWLGVALDEAANDRGDALLTREHSAVRAWVVEAEENLVVARHVRTLLRLP